MADTGEVDQILHDVLRFAGHQFGDQIVVQACEEFSVAADAAAIEQGDGEFDVVGFKAIAFRKAARSWAEFEAQIPQFLREALDLRLQFLFVGILAVVEKEKIDVGVREEPSAAVAA